MVFVTPGLVVTKLGFVTERSAVRIPDLATSYLLEKILTDVKYGLLAPSMVPDIGI